MTKYHRVFCTVSSLSVPSCPVSHRRSSCSALSDSARFGRLPFPACFNSFQALSCLYGTLNSLQYLHNQWFVSNAQCNDESLSNYRVCSRTRPGFFSSQSGIRQSKHSVLSQGCRQYHGFHGVGLEMPTRNLRNRRTHWSIFLLVFLLVLDSIYSLVWVMSWCNQITSRHQVQCTQDP